MKISKSMFLSIVFLILNSIVLGEATKKDGLNIAILGLGGRSQYLLIDCLKLNKNVRVTAVCDDYGAESLNFFINKLEKENNPLIESFKNSFAQVRFYADNNNGLQQLFKDHPNIDIIFITSANYNHFRHINAAFSYSSCKTIYIEKPLFANLEEFIKFKMQSDVNIYVGLTLRYSSMAKIVVGKLQEFQLQLGSLKKIKSWEHVRFAQSLTSFMMSWRRYISLSGGLLLEKCIHDLDLALFFLQSINIVPQDISITTEAFHNFFIKSQEQAIINRALADEEIQKTLVGRERSPFQRYVDFTMDEFGNIDWQATISKIFEGLPEDGSGDNSDIIPDYHKLSATICAETSSPIAFELEVKLGGFQATTKRGMHFSFEHGVVEIDVMKSSMVIALSNGNNYEFNLQTNNSDHANGDTYIAYTILGILPEGQFKATLTDPVVTLATVMGLISEHQALHKNNQVVHIKKIKDHWFFAPSDAAITEEQIIR